MVEWYSLVTSFRIRCFQVGSLLACKMRQLFHAYFLVFWTEDTAHAVVSSHSWMRWSAPETLGCGATHFVAHRLADSRHGTRCTNRGRRSGALLQVFLESADGPNSLFACAELKWSALASNTIVQARHHLQTAKLHWSGSNTKARSSKSFPHSRHFYAYNRGSKTLPNPPSKHFVFFYSRQENF
jgi:hypothetical protein